MLQHNKPRIHRRRIPQDRLERREGIRARDQATGDFPVVRVELAGGVGAGPDDGDHAHGEGDGADAVV